MVKVELQSSVVGAAQYEAASKTLHVYFKDGRKKIFREVPATTYEVLIASPSPGNFYQHHIRGCYQTHGTSR
ncbi:KTSC domain-containing protein [Rhizobium sp. CG5]|uniref:KTSC domain-containing protein n=1 Tax=Rhizobium sp. CG5 TaxID=2726076 RepID=UPI002033D683|nr:KTSC domain-containing protein [Rhizobium sp. CG5]MCM2476296.1 KTSC domain-containing protein [Rhizobium sp. CG5]